MTELKRPDFSFDKGKTEAFYDAIATQWSEKVRTDFWEPEFDIFRSLLRGKNVLEIGVGSGGDTTLFKDAELLPQYVGIDTSRNMLLEAQKRIPEARLVRMDMQELGFAGNTFDGIWMPTSLYHIPKQNVSDTLREIKRVMKPDAVGFIALVEGDGEGLSSIYAYPSLESYHASWRHEEFSAVLLQTGFAIDSFSRLEGNNMLLYFISPTNS